MKVLLLDTNIVIYLSKNIQYGDLYRSHVNHAKCVISFMTVAELYEGAFRTGRGTRKFAEMEQELRKYAVLECTPTICENFGLIRSTRKDRPISVPDAFVAATALAYGLPLVTHNKKDFEDISAELIDKVINFDTFALPQFGIVHDNLNCASLRTNRRSVQNLSPPQ